VPIARYALVAALGLVLLVGAMLLVRPLIFSVAPERGDANYALVAATALDDGPIERQLLLNESHGLPGEQPNGRRIALRVVLSEPATGGVAVVNAWSPTNRCAVTVAGDRLRDCAASTWTLEGIPISADRPLQRFPATVRAGAVIVDFTRPFDAG
jgi:hypothetical protein